ncbi:hypothetical protein FQN50_001811 [Emmonsiellopsis sp. PD_5]|nr:hypothetical protein FQN50_001811 [Emmonsiellopsis sp. PD_5]
MAISQKLNQRVRARPDEDEIEEFSDELASDEVSDEGESGAEDEEDTDGEGDEDGEDEDGQSNSDASSEADTNVTPSLQTISFGALAKAQASLGKRKRDPSTSHDAAASSSPSSRKRTAPSPPPASSEGPQEYPKKPRQTLSHRSSKHAPTIQSSRHAVTRKRTIIEPPAVPKARDPRFDSVVLNHSIPTSNTAALNKAAAHASKNYSFLNEYRSDELTALRKQLAIAQGKVPGKKGKQKKAKAGDPYEAERLKRLITSMTDRQRTFERKEKEKEVLAEHRRKEREMIREGKKSAPWFMKKGDVRKEADTKRFEEMGGKERARALERRRKKVAGKERREMPWGRRGVEGDGRGE